jgi:hypothetical protein
MKLTLTAYSVERTITPIQKGESEGDRRGKSRIREGVLPLTPLLSLQKEDYLGL